MDGFRIPVGEWADTSIRWLKENLDAFLDAVGFVLRWMVETLSDQLIAVPAILLIAILAVLGWLLRSWQFGVGSALGLLLVVGMDQWEPALQTLSLVLIAAVIAVVIAIPIGILAAKNATVSVIVRPVLDFMQTMPSFVYLIPTVLFFSIGFAPGVVSTIIFALPPGIRLTELGIRGVDPEKVEAGQAFGATPGQVLRGIQLPLASPTIMAGINQVIMLALSMAVVAGIAGANGSGKEVVAAISTLDIAQGVEAGLSIVVLAIYLDRLTSALGAPADSRHSLRSVIRRRRTPAPAA